MRERGLKYIDYAKYINAVDVAPVRERGLKSLYIYIVPAVPRSLP